MKTLTVSVAAYNMENYIEDTLKSLTDVRVIDDLEIFVVDDGGSDHTLEIAQRYASRYPKSVFPIHKQNEGYGSTVNYSIAHASGRYFKLLDGDDWFNTENLIRLVHELKSNDADIVINNYYKCFSGGEKVERVVDTADNGKSLSLMEWEIPPRFGMWAITYRTELLRQSKLQLPIRCLYTDRIYSVIPFAYANNLKLLEFPVYCYRLGRDGQSVSRESRIKHLNETIEICRKLCGFYEKNRKEGNQNSDLILLMVAQIHYITAIHTILLLPVNKINLKKLMMFEKEIKALSNDVYVSSVKKGKTGKLLWLMRRTHYLLYWSLAIVPKKFLDF